MIGIEFEGLAELNKVLQDMAKEFPRQVFDACRETGFLIERQAKLYETNVDTGNLRASIRTNLYEREGEVTVSAGGSSEGLKDVNYAVYQEFGTRYMPGLFFMTRAAQDGFRKLPEFLEKRMK